MSKSAGLIVISPYASRTQNGSINPKNYPKEYWEELLEKYKRLGYIIIQIGVFGDEPVCDSIDFLKFDLTLNKELIDLVRTADLCISVDNFFGHFCWYYNIPCVVLFGPSDPKLFGHPENLNIFKDEKFFRKYQFRYWWSEDCFYSADCFEDPKIVFEKIKKWRKND